MNRKLSFCLGNSRQASAWIHYEFSFEDLCERLEDPIRTSENTALYQKMKKGDKDAVKDKGGFLAGTLKGTRRKNSEVISRSMITLDSDKLTADFFDEYEIFNDYESVIYTTHSHTPEAPRGRILIPLTRDVKPDEYNAIARYISQDIGMDMIDPCSFKVNQMMYWPTVSADGEYICRRYSGRWLDPDVFLSEHSDWKDCTKLPASVDENAEAERQSRKQEDPLSKDGIVGVFCRTYTITEVMEKYLSEVYEPVGDTGRWRYIPSDSIPGVIVYEDRFVYSHHASDPAYGKLLNAFDLVRIHLFDDENPKKSFTAMSEFAVKDKEVQTTGLREHQESAAADFSDADDSGDWKEKLRYEKKSLVLENCLYNIKLIMQNDVYMKNIVFNQLADSLEIKGDVPWNHPAKFWRDADDSQLICYVDDNYGTFSARNYDIAVTKAADDRSYHPIREYFKALPAWDGVKRADTLLIDYLGAADNEYVRAVSRKTLCAACTRVFVPGIKFDYMPVLNGAQGIGKSTFISNLGMEWFSDSLNLSDMNDKTAAEKLQGYWIIEIGELAGMKKADLDKVKAFISRQDDKYRASFGRRVTPHLRQCIFFGTTNSENGYLRDITGNRRYWNVKVSGDSKFKPWQMTQDIVDQVWAETLVYMKAGESLYLPPELEEFAVKEQRSAMEQDDREGIVQEYIDMLLPANWESMDMYARRNYVRDTDDCTRPKGITRRTEVSNIEIWCECFGKAHEDMKASDSFAIAAIMTRLGGWTKPDIRKRIAIYGQQRIYRRKV